MIGDYLNLLAITNTYRKEFNFLKCEESKNPADDCRRTIIQRSLLCIRLHHQPEKKIRYLTGFSVMAVITHEVEESTRN